MILNNLHTPFYWSIKCHVISVNPDKAFSSDSFVGYLSFFKTFLSQILDWNISLLFVGGMLSKFVRYIPAGNHMFKVNNRNTRTRCKICSKLTIKTSERHLALMLTILQNYLNSNSVYPFIILTLYAFWTINLIQKPYLLMTTSKFIIAVWCTNTMTIYLCKFSYKKLLFH